MKPKILVGAITFGKAAKKAEEGVDGTDGFCCNTEGPR